MGNSEAPSSLPTEVRFSRLTVSPGPLVVLCAALVTSACPGGVRAQGPPEVTAPDRVAPQLVLTPQSGVERAPALADRHFPTDPARALLVLEQALAGGVDQPYALEWRAARSALVLGVLEENEDRELDWLLRAQAYADSALIRGDPGLDGLYWSAAVKGRLAMQYGIRTTARLAQEVWELSHAILAVDPDHPGAHNILGKLSQEVMSLSGWQRTLGRWVLGTEPLREASWEKALDHHRRAVAGDSTTILFHMDLGRTLQLSGDPEAARAHYDAVLALPESYPVDPRFKRLTRRYLTELPPPGR